MEPLHSLSLLNQMHPKLGFSHMNSCFPMHSYIRLNLWVYFILPSLLLLSLSMSTLAFPGLSSHCYDVLGWHYALVPLEVPVEHVQTISTKVGQAFLYLVLSLAYHVYRRSELDPLLYAHKSNTTYTFPQYLSAQHVAFTCNK